MKYKNVLHYGLLILGISISAILVVSFKNFYHYDDVRAFLAWSQVWNQGRQDIYKNCALCNYPILGMFSSAGLLDLLVKVSSQNAIWDFRILLAIIDGANVWLIYLLLRVFSIKMRRCEPGLQDYCCLPRPDQHCGGKSTASASCLCWKLYYGLSNTICPREGT